MNTLTGCTAVIGVLALMALIIRFQVRLMRGTRKAIELWASEQDLTLLSARLAWMGGPYPASAANRCPVFRVRVRDAEGEAREGWVRCTSWWGEANGATWDPDEPEH